MGFDILHDQWLKYHLQRRTGERRGRLERGHLHGEKLFLKKIWYAIFGNFDHLHPEYEVSDWRGRPFFIDLVWMMGKYKYAFEIKGFDPHVRNTDRQRYQQELNRETYLEILGFRVISIPYDTIENDPDLLIFLIRSLLSPYIAAQLKEEHTFTRLEQEIVRSALRFNRPIRPTDLVTELKISRPTALKYLRILCKKGKFRVVPAGNNIRVMRYEYVRSLGDDSLS